MTIFVELWARGLGMILAAYWPVIVIALAASIFLLVRKKWLLGAGLCFAALVIAPYVQIFVWDSQTKANRGWLGHWSGTFGESSVQIEFQTVSANTLQGTVIAGSCSVGEVIFAEIDNGSVTLMTSDAELFAKLTGDLTSLRGTVSGCGNSGRSETAQLVRSQDPPEPEVKISSDNTIDFRVSTPEGWAAAPLSGRMNWHVASTNGTELPDCGVIVTAHPGMASISNEEYIRAQNEQDFLKLVSASADDVRIGKWETDYELGKQRALHIIYSATIDGVRLSNLTIQTLHESKLYTFFCNAPLDEFPFIYADLLKVADSFEFVTDGGNQR
jgi:hypothetical protein